MFNDRTTVILLLSHISFYAIFQLVLCNIIDFDIINNSLYNQVVNHLLVFCEDKNGDKKKNKKEKEKEILMTIIKIKTFFLNCPINSSRNLLYLVYELLCIPCYLNFIYTSQLKYPHFLFFIVFFSSSLMNYALLMLFDPTSTIKCNNVMEWFGRCG